MKIINGKYAAAHVMTDDIEQAAIEQVQALTDAKVSEGCKIAIMPDVHAGKGCTIGTVMTIKDRVCPNLVGVDIGCLDKDTEYLTEEGWKRIEDYKEGDKVLQYDKDTDLASFVKPINYIVQECESFLHFKNSKGLDQMLSEEHKVLVWKGTPKRGYVLEDIRADELAKRSLKNGYYGVKASFQIDSPGLRMPEEEIRLDIMIAADGSIKYDRGSEHQIYLHFKKERKIERAKELLSSLEIPYKETLGQDGATHIYFFIAKRFNKDLSKYWKASKKELEVVAEESLLWDGHSGYRSYFSSTNKKNADLIQFAFSSCDVRAGMSLSKSKNKDWSDVHIVTPTRNRIVGVTQVSRVMSEDGKKYCFTVPSGYFVARRNGKIFITGNCGVLAVHLGEEKAEDIDFQLLQEAIDEYVPSGRNVHPNQKDMMRGRLGELTFKLSEKEATHLDRSLGTLGGGNHFISIESGKTGSYLLIHSGSRHLGVLVAQHHQRLAEKAQDNSKAKKDLIDRLKKEGREHEISAALNAFPRAEKEDLAYLSGAQAEDYLNDMKIAQDYARANRLTMAIRIVARMGWTPFWTIESVHNYIDTEKKILRKGAVAAELNSGFLVPLNMRDGTLIYMSKGENGSEWLDSAPHGAGRKKSRTKARAEGNLEEYKKSMQGIWSASVNEATLDENPNAYKDANSIIEILDKNFTKIDHLIPVFNFKANS